MGTKLTCEAHWRQQICVVDEQSYSQGGIFGSLCTTGTDRAVTRESEGFSVWWVNECWQFSHFSVAGFSLGAANRPSRQKQRFALHFPIVSITVRTNGGLLMGDAGDVGEDGRLNAVVVIGMEVEGGCHISLPS